MLLKNGYALLFWSAEIPFYPTFKLHRNSCLSTSNKRLKSIQESKGQTMTWYKIIFCCSWTLKGQPLHIRAKTNLEHAKGNERGRRMETNTRAAFVSLLSRNRASISGYFQSSERLLHESVWHTSCKTGSETTVNSIDVPPIPLKAFFERQFCWYKWYRTKLSQLRVRTIQAIEIFRSELRQCWTFLEVARKLTHLDRDQCLDRIFDQPLETEQDHQSNLVSKSQTIIPSVSQAKIWFKKSRELSTSFASINKVGAWTPSYWTNNRQHKQFHQCCTNQRKGNFYWNCRSLRTFLDNRGSWKREMATSLPTLHLWGYRSYSWNVQ